MNLHTNIDFVDHLDESKEEEIEVPSNIPRTQENQRTRPHPTVPVRGRRRIFADDLGSVRRRLVFEEATGGI